MVMRGQRRLKCLLICVSLVALASASPLSAQASSTQSLPTGKTLFVLASNIEAPILNSDPVSTVLYSVSSDKGLVSKAVVLQGSAITGARNSLPDGVFSINEVGGYLVVEYPHDTLCCAIFIPENDPLRFESVRIASDGVSVLKCGLGSIQTGGTTACVTWDTSQGDITFDANGMPIIPKTTLLSLCKTSTQPLYTAKDQWGVYRSLRFDGVTSADEGCWSWAKNGVLWERFLNAPEAPITELPHEFSFLVGTRRVSLDAASERYLTVGIAGEDMIDRNTNVFVQTVADGRWRRLPVFPVGIIGTDPTKMDRMGYRLFDDWLVTSASAALLSANHITESIIPDVLTVAETGKQRDDLGVKVEPRTTPDVATLPARRITLWNLADNRRIDLAIPEDDSEIVHVFDGHSVLLRIKEMLFSAEIQGSKLTDYKLVAHDSAIPQVHWAFYSSAK